MVEQVKQTVGKMIGFALIVFFVALGVIGILLPIIPGLVFLFIAALMAARYFPALEFLLNRNRFSARCVRISNRFFEMGIWDRTRLCFWGTIKITLEGLQYGVAGFKKGTRFLMSQFRGFRSR